MSDEDREINDKAKADILGAEVRERNCGREVRVCWLLPNNDLHAGRSPPEPLQRLPRSWRARRHMGDDAGHLR